MRRINGSEGRDMAALHTGSPPGSFAESHPHRIATGRRMLEKCIVRGAASVIDLGCGMCDISGPYADAVSVLGIDIHVGAQLAEATYPGLGVFVCPIEDIDPGDLEFDALVMTELLEHLDDPLIANAWLSRARFAVIGHPLDDEDGIEGHHAWSFTEEDFKAWFSRNGLVLQEMETFGLGPFKRMAMGWGTR